MRIKKQKNNSLGTLGKVKTGETKKNASGTTYPTSLDYFRFTSDVARRVADMKNIFGDKPREIEVTFDTDNINEVCSQRFELRDKSGKLIVYGDGSDYFLSEKNGFMKKTPTEIKELKLVKKYKTSNFTPKWEETLILKFIILKCKELGRWEYRTKAKESSIPQIIGSFDAVMSYANSVVGVPFVLTVKKHKSNRVGEARQYPVVDLVCNLTLEMQELAAVHGANIRGLITPQKLAELPKGISAPVPPDAPDAESDEIEFEEV